MFYYETNTDMLYVFVVLTSTVIFLFFGFILCLLYKNGSQEEEEGRVDDTSYKPTVLATAVKHLNDFRQLMTDTDRFLSVTVVKPLTDLHQIVTNIHRCLTFLCGGGMLCTTLTKPTSVLAILSGMSTVNDTLGFDTFMITKYSNISIIYSLTNAGLGSYPTQIGHLMGEIVRPTMLYEYISPTSSTSSNANFLYMAVASIFSSLIFLFSGLLLHTLLYYQSGSEEEEEVRVKDSDDETIGWSVLDYMLSLYDKVFHTKIPLLNGKKPTLFGKFVKYVNGSHQVVTKIDTFLLGIVIMNVKYLHQQVNNINKFMLGTVITPLNYVQRVVTSSDRCLRSLFGGGMHYTTLPTPDSVLAITAGIFTFHENIGLLTKVSNTSTIYSSINATLRPNPTKIGYLMGGIVRPPNTIFSAESQLNLDLLAENDPSLENIFYETNTDSVYIAVLSTLSALLFLFSGLLLPLLHYKSGSEEQEEVKVNDSDDDPIHLSLSNYILSLYNKVFRDSCEKGNSKEPTFFGTVMKHLQNLFQLGTAIDRCLRCHVCTVIKLSLQMLG